jgi:hypothetical protein
MPIIKNFTYINFTKKSEIIFRCNLFYVTFFSNRLKLIPGFVSLILAASNLMLRYFFIT